MKLQKPNKKQVIITASVFSFIALVVGFYYTIKAIDKFFATNTVIFSSPITVKTQAPIVIKSRAKLKEEQEWDKTATELATKCVNDYLNPPQEVEQESAQKAAISPSVFFDTIWSNESTRGRDVTPNALHLYCRARGLWNEIGYNPQDKFCFKDRDHAEAKIRLWLIENCQNKTMAQCLCYYNEGRNSASCAYSEGDLKNAN